MASDVAEELDLTMTIRRPKGRGGQGPSCDGSRRGELRPLVRLPMPLLRALLALKGMRAQDEVDAKYVIKKAVISCRCS